MGELHQRIRKWAETAPDSVLNLVLIAGIVYLAYALLTDNKVIKILGVLILLV